MKEIQKLIIYFFSGTGNSKNVARWLSEEAATFKIECQLYDIASIDGLRVERPDPAATIVFISPVHGFNYPPIMLHFLSRFPKSKNQVLLLNTRGGMRIGRFVTPGLSGVTFYLASIILGMKGYSIHAMFPVDMPSNWISLHPGLNQRTIEYLHKVNRDRVRKFAEKVFQGIPVFKGMAEIVQDMLIAPVSIGYFLVGRFFFAKTFFASSACNGCRLCIKQCPVQAIQLVDHRPFWTFHCESCMHCMSACPQKAIETGHGYVALFVFLFYAVIVGNVYHLLESFSTGISNGYLRVAVDSGLILVFLMVGYRMIHFGLRFHWIERLIVYTSLTSYKWWGRRYKAIKNYARPRDQ